MPLRKQVKFGSFGRSKCSESAILVRVWCAFILLSRRSSRTFFLSGRKKEGGGRRKERRIVYVEVGFQLANGGDSVGEIFKFCLNSVPGSCAASEDEKP